MTKKIAKVFPDYCSTGVWVDGANADPEFLGVSIGLRIALDYWHQYWEGALSGDWDENGHIPSKVGEFWKQRWVEDGKILVQLMNEENDEYKFVVAFGINEL